MTDRMKPEVKALWLDALRSGEYKQGRGFLNKEGKFCCLGVLCEVAIQQGVEVPKVSLRSPWVAYGRSEETATLPVEVRQWAGMDSLWGVLPADVDGCDSLAHLNDEGAPFGRIADVIEEKL